MGHLIPGTSGEGPLSLPPRHVQGLRFSARTTLDVDVGETYLFHGTSAGAASKIVREGFVKSSNGWYGPGVYFADDPRTSDQYTRKGYADDGCSVVLLCRVVLGNVAAYRSSTAGAADSLVGGGGFLPKELIVQDEAQIYPEYVVYYTTPLSLCSIM